MSPPLEAALLHDLVSGFKPHVWVNFHTGMEALFMPYDHVARMPTGPNAEVRDEAAAHTGFVL